MEPTQHKDKTKYSQFYCVLYLHIRWYANFSSIRELHVKWSVVFAGDFFPCPGFCIFRSSFFVRDGSTDICASAERFWSRPIQECRGMDGWMQRGISSGLGSPEMQTDTCQLLVSEEASVWFEKAEKWSLQETPSFYTHWDNLILGCMKQPNPSQHVWKAVIV